MGLRPDVTGEGRGDVGPPTSAMEVVGEIGRTPVPVAESTHHPGEKPLPSVRDMREKDLIKRVNLQLLHKAREGPLERLEVTMKEGNLNGHCPGPQIRVDLQRQR